ncbi:MAG TPA: M13 family metallopeptidase [Candidatus Sulfotelmatobacter sp.]|nr:M13 family metallopeptidase [Candidatus Sulfotelmatobacter sp.]
MRICRILLAPLLLLLAFTLTSAWAESGNEAPLNHFDPNQVDRSLDPCTDFFQYACKSWIKANPITSDLASTGTGVKLVLWNIGAVHKTLEEDATAFNRSNAEQQAGDYYAACMNVGAVNKAGLKPLQPQLDRIAALRQKKQLPELLASLHLTIRPADLNFIDAQYNGILFGLYAQPDFDDARVNVPTLDQSGMNLPGREFYLNDDDKSKEIRSLYVEHVAKMLELSGERNVQAEADAKAILAFETNLAKAAMDIVARRDPKNQDHKLSLAEVQALTPSFDWSRYFAAIHAPVASRYLVLHPDFFRGVEKLISNEPIEHWRAYLRYSLLSASAPFLSDAFLQENFSFVGRRLFGLKELQPRWRRCSFNADSDLGEAVGQAYVAKYFPAENKERMLQMVKAIEGALHRDIDAADWMSPETKKLAHAKLSAQIDKIGYPDRWREYQVEIKRDDFIGNVQRSAEFEMRRRIAKFGKPVDRYEFGMTPPTVNAYEDSQSNTINFPAGMLQPPYFDSTQIDAVNYGAIGAVIGHEITHGFDDQGRKFDADGNLKDWWTVSDAANYEQRDKCIQDEYTQDVPEAGAGVKQDGKLSAGEDTADNGGIHLALSALESSLKTQNLDLDSMAPDGLSELQNFFLSYANVWCGELRPEAARTAVMTQGHSLGRYRVNNVIANMPEFAHAFGCHSGQPMVHANSCRVW